MDYRFVATTIEGFVQQLAVGYVGHGYWFYVTGVVPPGKDALAIDRKLILKYRIDISRSARVRRKRRGLANLHYIRFDRFFAIVATHGEHDFFAEERACFKDARETPIKFGSYAVSYRGGHPHVRIERETYRDLKALFLADALRPVAELESTFWRLPFEPYAPVRRQIVTIFKRVNDKRRAAQLEPLSMKCLRLRRKIFRPFDLAAQADLRRAKQSRRLFA